MTFSETVRAIRAHVGLSQKELAKELGVAFATVNRWERGHSLPAASAKEKLTYFCRGRAMELEEIRGDFRIIALEGAETFEQREERLSKAHALALFDTGEIDSFEVGTFRGLAQIHGALFRGIYDFAGTIRQVNLAKGSFRFAPVMYLEDALRKIEAMPQDSFDAIVEKYVEMNVAHPFREGNGRSMRLWLDAMLKKELGQVIDWSLVGREDYLLAMERSPVRDVEIKALLRAALTDRIRDREVFMKGVDASYLYEGYSVYRTEELG